MRETAPNLKAMTRLKWLNSNYSVRWSNSDRSQSKMAMTPFSLGAFNKISINSQSRCPLCKNNVISWKKNLPPTFRQSAPVKTSGGHVFDKVRAFKVDRTWVKVLWMFIFLSEVKFFKIQTLYTYSYRHLPRLGFQAFFTSRMMHNANFDFYGRYIIIHI